MAEQDKARAIESARRLGCHCSISKVVSLPATPGFGPFRQYFSPDSIMHPAKAPLYLLQYLIECYSKPGDMVLDPMAGTGSTLIMSSLLGRNAVGVELEERFCGWIENSIKRTETSGRARGSMRILRGDSRNLRRLLSRRSRSTSVHTVVTSPPYGSIKKGGSPDEAKLRERVQRLTVEGRYTSGDYTTFGRLRHRSVLASGYSNSPLNIGNLPDGGVDEVITSPPYSEGIGHTQGKPGTKTSLEVMMSDAFRQKLALEERHMLVKESANTDNIGSVDHETYLGAMLKVYKECREVLKNDGIFVLILKDFIRDKKPVLLHEHTIELCHRAGFRLEEVVLSKLSFQSLWRSMYVRRNPEVPRLDYEHILVFRSIKR